MEPENPLLDDYVLAQSRRSKPRICFLGCASGDAASYVEKFYLAFSQQACDPTHLAMFVTPPPDIASIIPRQDIFYVGGGSTRNLLVLWREWGLDRLLAREWRRGKGVRRPQRGLALLVRIRRERLLRANARPGVRAGMDSRAPLPALRRRSRASANVPSPRRKRENRGRLRRRRWRRAAFRRASSSPCGKLAPQREGVPCLEIAPRSGRTRARRRVSRRPALILKRGGPLTAP